MLQFSEIKDLLAQADDDTLTLYIDVNPATPENQATTPAWRIWLKNTLRDMDSSLNGNRNETWAGLRNQLEVDMADYTPETRGLVLLYGNGFSKQYPMPMSFENRAVYGRPVVMPLLWALDEFEPYVVVLVDSEKASFFTTFLGDAEHRQTDRLELDIEDWKGTGSDPTGSGNVTNSAGQDDLQHRIEEHITRFYRGVSEQIQKTMKQTGARRLILGGNEQSAHALKALLPDQVKAQVVDILNIPLRTPTPDVLSKAMEVGRAYERQQERSLVEDVVNLAKAGGRGAVGHDAVRRALEEHRVELLILPWPVADEQEAERLTRLVMESSGDIELVYGDAAEILGAEGGIAARLYYTYSAVTDMNKSGDKAF